MRISVLVKATSIGILVAIALMTASVFWANNQLSKIDRQFAEYNDVSKSITIDLYRAVQAYLTTGNAVKLSEAETIAADLINKIKSTDLDEKATKRLVDQLSLLLTKTQEKYRAIGKLGGNAFVLLENAERGILDSADSLLNYSQEGADNNPMVAKQLMYLSAKVMYLSQDLVKARESYAQNTDVNEMYQAKNNVDSVLMQISQRIDEIESLPIFGVYEESDEDECSLFYDEEDQTDKGEEFISELGNLTRRYPKGLENTSSLLAGTQLSLQELQQEIGQIEIITEQGQQVLTQKKADTYDSAQLLTAVMLILVIVGAALNYAVLYKLVLRPLRYLRNSFHALVTRGEIERIDDSAHPEFGEIAI